MNSGEDAVEQQAQPALCVKCNSFFSNAACNDLCSKCHRELESSQAKTAAAGAAIEALVRSGTGLSLEAQTAPASAATTSSPAPSSTPAVSSATPPPPGDGSTPPKAGPSRCHECRKKVGLTGFKCKCGQLFCGQHRYAESHACAFDHKGAGRAKLAEANPLVMAKKVQQI